MHDCWNIQTQCYISAADSLGLSFVQRAPEEAGWSEVVRYGRLRSLKLVPNGEARMRITVIVYYSDAMPIFYRFRYITIYWKFSFFRIYTHCSLVWSHRYESWYPKKLEVHGLCDGEHQMSLRSLVLTYYHRVLDRQADVQTHRL